MAMPPGLAAYIANKNGGGGGNAALKKEVYDKGKPPFKKKGKKVTDKAKAEAIARKLNKKE
jgi:hypothetical protein